MNHQQGQVKEIVLQEKLSKTPRLFDIFGGLGSQKTVHVRPATIFRNILFLILFAAASTSQEINVKRPN